jgi:hypothetical protein
MVASLTASSSSMYCGVTVTIGSRLLKLLLEALETDSYL